MELVLLRIDRLVALRAVTDCEVLVLAAGVVDEVGSRNADMVTAFNRLVALRQRRIQRLAQDRLPGPTATPAGAEGS